MAAQSFLAKDGLRTGVLGTSSSLGIAFALNTGDYNPDAGTDPTRTGFYADRTALSQKMSCVVEGTEQFSVGAPGVSSIFSGAGAANAAPVLVNGTWFSGGSSTSTKPQLLIEPAGTTSNAWSTSGTGIGVNAAAGFTGTHFAAQVDAVPVFTLSATGAITVGIWNGSVISPQYGGTGFDGSTATNGQIPIGNGAGFTLATITDTANRLTVTNGVGSITLDIAGTYVGQTSITTLGTIATGVWQSTLIAPMYGGTGVNGAAAANGSLLIGNGSGYTLSTITGTSNRLSVTNGPGSITLDIDANYAGQTSITTLGGIGTGTWQATPVAAQYGGTGINGATAPNGTLLIGNSSGYSLNTLTAGTNISIVNGIGTITINATAGGGTVTSVALALPVSVFTVSGSPVTTTGTLTGSFTTQTANTVFSGPTTGGAATPTFRALVAADIPNLDTSKITTGIFLPARGGTGVDGSAAPNGAILIGNTAGYSLNTITGTVNRLSVSNGVGSITLDIDAAYVGQTSITTLGTITTGTWQGTAVAAGFGGTGVDGSAAPNGSLLIGTGSGYALNTLTGTTNRFTVTNGSGVITLDIAANYAGQTSIATLGTVTTGSWQATQISAQFGGTGINGSTAANGTLVIGNGAGYSLATLTAGTGVSIVNAAGSITINATGSGGTVTSVALALPVSVFTVTGSPVTTTGTLTGSFANQAANTVFAGPTTGAATTPAFRALVAADIPNLDASIITTGILAVARGGTGVDGSAATNGQLLIGNGAGFSLNTLTGTANRISIANSVGTITINIDSNYVGQASITTLGTITTGTWQASIINAQYGGTGLNGSTAANGSLLIGNGSGYSLNTLTGTANRLSVTNGLGTITLNIDTGYVGQTSITTLGTITTGTWNGTIVAPQYGGTGVNGATAANGTLLIGNGTGYSLATLIAGTGIVITNGAGTITIDSPDAGGTVTSVALTMPSIFSVVGSPITTSGTLAVSLAAETANTVFAGPTAGGPVAPTFRALVSDDIPNLDASKITTGQLAVARGGTGIDGSAAANGTLLIGNGTGYTLATATGTSNRLTVTNGAGSITLDIAATYVGQTSITTLGTIGTGTWRGTIVETLFGGTGLNTSTAANGQLLIGTGSGLALATITGTTNRLSVTNGSGTITLDISAAYVGQTSITTLGTIGTGVWQGTLVAPQFGGTGVNGATAANGTLLIGNGTGYTLATLTAGTGISIGNAAGAITVNNTGVTSVALALPSIFSVSGSPVTTTGTLTGTLTTQTANTVFAGPTTGGAATPTFRALVAADLPASQGATTVTSMTVSNLTATRVTYAGTAGLLTDDSGFTRVAATSLTVDSGLDSTTTLGTLKIGVPASGTATSTYLGSTTNFTNVAYSFLLNTNGDTTINAKTGRSIFHAVNNTTFMTMTASSISVTSAITTATFNATTASTSAATGALVVAGGIGANNIVTNTTVGYTATSAPGSPLDGDVWNDSTQKTLAYRNAGLTTYKVAAMFMQTGTTTVASTTAETTMFSTGVGTLTLPANFLTVGKTLRITIMGSWVRAAATNIQFRVRLGGVLIVDSTVESTNNTSGTPSILINSLVTCRTTGASGTAFGELTAMVIRDSTNPGNGNMYGDSATHSGTIDTTTSLAVDATITTSANSASNILTIYNAIVEVLG